MLTDSRSPGEALSRKTIYMGLATRLISPLGFITFTEARVKPRMALSYTLLRMMTVIILCQGIWSYSGNGPDVWPHSTWWQTRYYWYADSASLPCLKSYQRDVAQWAEHSAGDRCTWRSSLVNYTGLFFGIDWWKCAELLSLVSKNIHPRFCMYQPVCVDVQHQDHDADRPQYPQSTLVWRWEQICQG